MTIVTAEAATAAADNPKLLSSLQIQFQLNPLHRMHYFPTAHVLYRCGCGPVCFGFFSIHFLFIFAIKRSSVSMGLSTVITIFSYSHLRVTAQIALGQCILIFNVAGTLNLVQ